MSVNNQQKQKILDKARQQLERVRAYRKEASRKVSLANKRIARLEKAGLKDSPAYQAYIESGGGKFSIRGKSYRETQAEVARLDRLINAETSTVRGSYKVLKNFAKKANIEYTDMADLQRQQKEMFEYVSKYNQYASTVLDAASAIGYKQVWDAANIFIKETQGQQKGAKLDIKAAIESMQKSIDEFNKNNKIDELFKL